MEQYLKNLVDWTLANGVTPDFVVKVATTTTGSHLSPDERGERFSGYHSYRVVASTDRYSPMATLAIFPAGSVDIDSSLSEDHLIRPYLEACYKALVGEPLPTGEEGSERYLAEGTYLHKGSHESDRVHWEIVRENSAKGFFVEIRYTYGAPSPEKQVYTRRLTKSSFKDSKVNPGGKYLTGFRHPLASLTADQWEEVQSAFE